MAHQNILQFPVNPNPQLCKIKDKVRNSGLTSVRWVDENTCVAADFALKKLYLIKIKNVGYDIIFETDTIIKNGKAVETDLMDYRDGIVVLTNFNQGTLSFYKLFEERLIFLKELIFSQNVRLHGVRFIPGYDDLVWVSYCGEKNKCHQIVNFETGQIVHNISLSEQAQDVAFISNKYAVVFGRTNHITLPKKFWRPKKKMYASAFLYSLPENLYQSAPLLESEWKGSGHLDAAKEFNGLIYAANQYDSCVDIFTVKDKQIVKMNSIEGFAMPHGLDVDARGRLIVTNYSDNTLRLVSLF